MSVTQVSSERWKQAQEWELQVWQDTQRRRGWRRYVWPVARPLLNLIGRGRKVSDDWNHWWAEKFEKYSALPREMRNYIELGCGPFTNTRVILGDRRAQHVVCSDPLAREYVRMGTSWLAHHHRSGALLVDDHPIEECPFADDYFDVVVMINVLDHVQDAPLCIRNAMRITRPGGFLVVGQDLSDDTDIKKFEYDVGHPIRLTLEDVEAHITGFEPKLRKVLSREEGRAPEAHYGTLIFIGQKSAR